MQVAGEVAVAVVSPDEVLILDFNSPHVMSCRLQSCGRLARQRPPWCASRSLSSWTPIMSLPGMAAPSCTQASGSGQMRQPPMSGQPSYRRR